jgi:chromosome segregation ATPase
LTWLTLDCLATANAAVKAQRALSTTTAKFNGEVLTIELKIAELKPSLDEIQVKLDKAKARLPEASSDLAAAKIKLITVVSASDKVIATKAVTDLEGAVKNWTAAAKAYTSQINQIQSAIKLMERSRLTLLNKPAELASNVSIARENAKLICYKGL